MKGNFLNPKWTRGGWNSQQEKTREYREKDKEVKKRCREDRNKYILEKTKEAEEAAVSGDSKTLFHIVKELAGKTKMETLPIKKSSGQITKTHDEQVQRWREHFEGVLNCPEPTVQFEASDMLHESEVLDIGTDAITEDEVRKAMQSLKNGKAAGNDGIKAEMIKCGGDSTIAQLTKLCNVIWTTGRIPTTWKDSIIIPLPKREI